MDSTNIIKVVPTVACLKKKELYVLIYMIHTYAYTWTCVCVCVGFPVASSTSNESRSHIVLSSLLIDQLSTEASTRNHSPM